MIARGTPRCCQLLRPALCRSSTRHARVHSRRYSSPASAGVPAAGSSSSAGILAPFTNELDRIAPYFRVQGSQIRIIRTPTDFYETLKEKIRSAKRRVFLSTLYIGKSEKELVRRVIPAHAAPG